MNVLSVEQHGRATPHVTWMILFGNNRDWVTAKQLPDCEARQILAQVMRSREPRFAFAISLAVAVSRTLTLQLDAIWHGLLSRPGTETTPDQGSRALIVQQTCRRFFSAVSKPIIVSKHSFCNICKDLQYLHTSAPLQIQDFQNLASFCKE